MKDFEKLTQKELATLTEGQLESYVRKAIVKEGIPLIYPELPTTDAMVDVPAPTDTVYRIGVFGNNIVFKNINDAEKVVALLHGMEGITGMDYTYVEGTSKYYKEPLPEGDFNNWSRIERLDVFETRTEVHKVTEALKHNAVVQGEINEYEKAVSELETKHYEISSKIKDKYWKAVSAENEKYKLKEIFWEEYYPLADNDLETAKNFFRKAYEMEEADFIEITTPIEEDVD